MSKHISEIFTKSLEDTFNKVTEFKNERDEVISRMVIEINRLREGTKYKPITKRLLAIKINKNPFLKDLGELQLVFSECLKNGSFAKLFWLLK